MPSPVDAGVATTNVTTAAAAWTVNLPASIAAGDLLVMFTRQATLVLHGSNSGWVTKAENASDASDDATSFAFKIATGSEGSTMSWNQNSSCKGAAICWRVTGAFPYDSAFSTSSPDWSASNFGTGANTDPGNVTIPQGVVDALFIEITGCDGTGITFSPSTGYGNIQQANSGTGGVAADNVCIASATKQATASSDNPDFMVASGAAASGWCAFTIAIRPLIIPVIAVPRVYPPQKFGPF